MAKAKEIEYKGKVYEVSADAVENPRLYSWVSGKTKTWVGVGGPYEVKNVTPPNQPFQWPEATAEQYAKIAETSILVNEKKKATTTKKKKTTTKKATKK